MQERTEWEWWTLGPKVATVFICTIIAATIAIFVGHKTGAAVVLALGTLLSLYFDISEQLIDIRKRLGRIENALTHLPE